MQSQRWNTFLFLTAWHSCGVCGGGEQRAAGEEGWEGERQAALGRCFTEVSALDKVFMTPGRFRADNQELHATRTADETFMNELHRQLLRFFFFSRSDSTSGTSHHGGVCSHLRRRTAESTPFFVGILYVLVCSLGGFARCKVTNIEVVMSDLASSLISWKFEPVILPEGFDFWLQRRSETIVADKPGQYWWGGGCFFLSFFEPYSTHSLIYLFDRSPLSLKLRWLQEKTRALESLLTLIIIIKLNQAPSLQLFCELRAINTL